MNTNQKNTLEELSEEFYRYIGRYGVGESSKFIPFEDEVGNIYIYDTRGTLRADFAGVDYETNIIKVDKAGFHSLVEPIEYEEGGVIEYFKKLKKVKLT